MIPRDDRDGGSGLPANGSNLYDGTSVHRRRGLAGSTAGEKRKCADGFEFGTIAGRRPLVPGLRAGASIPTGSRPGRTGGLPSDAWQADIRIVDGGHTVTWRAGAARVVEVLGASAAPVPAAGLLLDCPVRHERTALITPGASVEYQTSFEVERLDPEVFAHLCDEMTLDSARDRLFHRSSSGDRLAPAAISHLAFESRPKGLLVHGLSLVPRRPGDRPHAVAVRNADRPIPLPLDGQGESGGRVIDQRTPSGAINRRPR